MTLSPGKVVAPTLFSFSCTETLAEACAAQLKTGLHLITTRRFPDGESLVTVPAKASGTGIVFCSLDRPNEKLVELLLAADALRRQGVSQLTLVAPYLGYMRQDRVFHQGEPISQRVVAKMLDSAFDDVITVEAHLHRISSLSEVFSVRAESVSAAAPIADWLNQTSSRGLIVGPDSESEPWIKSIAERCSLPFVVASKTRHGDQYVDIDLPETPADESQAWIIDDIASSGATLETLASRLTDRGFSQVGAVVVHALFSPETLERLNRAGITSVVSTDSIRHPTNGVSIAPLLADVIRRHLHTPEFS